MYRHSKTLDSPQLREKWVETRQELAAELQVVKDIGLEIASFKVSFFLFPFLWQTNAHQRVRPTKTPNSKKERSHLSLPRNKSNPSNSHGADESVMGFGDMGSRSGDIGGGGVSSGMDRDVWPAPDPPPVGRRTFRKPKQGMVEQSRKRAGGGKRREKMVCGEMRGTKTRKEVQEKVCVMIMGH